MKKYILSFVMPLAAVALAVVFSIPQVSLAQTSTGGGVMVACPVGYTCYPLPVCPEGYVCTPINNLPGCPEGYNCTQTVISIPPVITPACHIFTQTLLPYFRDTSIGHKRSTGPEVIYLQTWLIAHGFPIVGIAYDNDKGYFGQSTMATVRRYQMNVMGMSSDEATGNFGQRTMDRVNATVKKECGVPPVLSVFPHSIGTYNLADQRENNPPECDVINGDKICTTEVSLEYRDTISNKVVFIKIYHIDSESVNAYVKYVKDHTTSLGLNLYRVEQHEILWLFAQGNNSIIAQYGQRTQDNSGGWNYSYPEEADKNNPVIANFIKQYPPQAIIDTQASSTITVLSPNGGEEWYFGQPQIIKWDSQNLSGNINVAFFLISGGICTIANVPVRNASYMFNPQEGFVCPENANGLPSLRSGTYKLFLYTGTLSDQGTYDYSNAPFLLTGTSTPDPSVTVLNPRPGEVLESGSTYTFRWKAYGMPSSGYAFIRLLNADGTNFDTLQQPAIGGTANTCIVGTSFVDSPIPQACVSINEGALTVTIPDYTNSDYGISPPVPTQFKLDVICKRWSSQSCNNSIGSEGTGGVFSIVPKQSNSSSVSATLVDASSDKVGGSFGPGVGITNKNPNDWHWQVAVTSSQLRTVKWAYLKSNTYGDGWATTDNTRVTGKVMYPLYVTGKGYENTAFNQTVPINAGTTYFDVYGQPETVPFAGGTLTLAFTDGTTATANIPASKITQGSTCSVGSTCSSVLKVTGPSEGSVFDNGPDQNIIISWVDYSGDFDDYNISIGNYETNARVSLGRQNKDSNGFVTTASKITSGIGSLSSYTPTGGYYAIVEATKADWAGSRVVALGNSGRFSIPRKSIAPVPTPTPYLTPTPTSSPTPTPTYAPTPTPSYYPTPTPTPSSSPSARLIRETMGASFYDAAKEFCRVNTEYSSWPLCVAVR
jgi:hypothetical protein